MAEIKIEKKKTIWPWILLGLLILAGIIYFVLASDDDEEFRETEVLQQVEQPVETSAIDKYSAYIGDAGRMGIDHEYSNGALIYLIDAVQQKADEKGVDLSADLNEARSMANEITEDPESLKHADLIKNSGSIIAKALSTLQSQSYPNLAEEASAVQKSVNDITKATPTLEQKEKVKDFFSSAENLLNKMK